MKGNNLWFLDSGCSKHMTGDESKFLSLSVYHEGIVTFENNLIGNIVAVGKIGMSLSRSIDNVFLVKGSKHSLLSISQFCDRNLVKFTNESCVFSNKSTRTKILKGTRKGNTYMVDLNLFPRNNLTCLIVIEEDLLLWHKRCGHANLSLLNKLNGKYLVVGLPTIKFLNHGVCGPCVKRKQVRSSFKSTKVVSTQSPLELSHMDLCGPVSFKVD